MFEGTDEEFKRECFMSSRYTFFNNENQYDDDEATNNEEANELEKNNPTQKKELPCGHTYHEHFWYDKPKKPTILEAGKMSDKIYLIISGPIYIMDINCQYEYGLLHSGSYFGETSLFFNEPN